MTRSIASKRERDIVRRLVGDRIVGERGVEAAMLMRLMASEHELLRHPESTIVDVVSRAADLAGRSVPLAAAIGEIERRAAADDRRDALGTEYCTLRSYVLQRVAIDHPQSGVSEADLTRALDTVIDLFSWPAAWQV